LRLAWAASTWRKPTPGIRRRFNVRLASFEPRRILFITGASIISGRAWNPPRPKTKLSLIGKAREPRTDDCCRAFLGWRDPKVIELLQAKAVAVKIDAEEERDLASRYRIGV